MKYILLSLLTLGACASNNINTLTEQGVPYCYSSEVIVNIDGKLQATTVLECTGAVLGSLHQQGEGSDLPSDSHVASLTRRRNCRSHRSGWRWGW